MEAVKILDKLSAYLDMVASTGFFTDEELEDIYKLEDKLYKLIKDKEIKDAD